MVSELSHFPPEDAEELARGYGQGCGGAWGSCAGIRAFFQGRKDSSFSEEKEAKRLLFSCSFTKRDHRSRNVKPHQKQKTFWFFFVRQKNMLHTL
jgi:hypothetical protein